MSALEVTFEVAAIVASSASVLGVPAGAAWLLKRLRRANQADTAAAITHGLQPVQAKVDAASVGLARIEGQFGPNGGGLREKVNEISGDVKSINARFDDHLQQAADDRSRLTAVEQALRGRQ